VANRTELAPAADMTGPLAPGVRVSLELPEAGTCVAVVKTQDDTILVLDLLDDVPDGELTAGSRLDLFMPRDEGIYRWPCTLTNPPDGQRAEVQLLNLPMFVQRRLGRRLDARLQAEVRRVRSGRRGKPHEAVVADLSHGGLKLTGEAQVSTGDTIEVSIDLGTPVRLTGRVVMAYPTAPGAWAAHVSFNEGQVQATEAVDAYIAGQLTAGSKPRARARR
jgi:PilZ domain